MSKMASVKEKRGFTNREIDLKVQRGYDSEIPVIVESQIPAPSYRGVFDCNQLLRKESVCFVMSQR